MITPLIWGRTKFHTDCSTGCIKTSFVNLWTGTMDDFLIGPCVLPSLRIIVTRLFSMGLC